MTVIQLKKELALKIFSGSLGIERERGDAYCTDVLSDALGHARPHQLWITIQQHKSVMAIASLKKLSALLLPKGVQPDQDTMEESNREGIPILGSEMEYFELAGRVYELLNRMTPTSHQKG